jgi:AmpD protein
MDIEDHLLKDIKFLNSPNFNNRPEEKNINLIVIHSISLPPKEYGGNYVESFFLNKLCISDHEYFKRIKDLKVSPHLYIKRDGVLIQFVPFNKRAWHAGESNFKGVSDCNDYSIGIELEGSEDDFFSQEQYSALILVTKAIIKKYPLIKKENIAGHSDISPGRKKDPGAHFDWSLYLGSL